jgi:hypothetical protein
MSRGSAAYRPLGQLTEEELAVVAASLAEAGRRLDGLRERLARLQLAVEVSSGKTCRSTRPSRSSSLLRPS